MNRNLQIKVVLIFLILGILLIAGLGLNYIVMLKQLEDISINNMEMIELINNQLNQTKIILAVSTGVYVLVSIFLGFFISRSLVSPMKKLIKSAEKIASGENIEIEKTKKVDNEVGDLTNAFSIMTTELKQKFNEVDRQKRQIETILLHMTDGIIAFDMEGKIIHINPAAKELLSITEKEDTFEKIFRKLWKK